eukprot:scaffold422_cov399-Prasinococcus_capsulatus_cf.AAC.16
MVESNLHLIELGSRVRPTARHLPQTVVLPLFAILSRTWHVWSQDGLRGFAAHSGYGSGHGIWWMLLARVQAPSSVDRRTGRARFRFASSPGK